MYRCSDYLSDRLDTRAAWTFHENYRATMGEWAIQGTFGDQPHASFSITLTSLASVVDNFNYGRQVAASALSNFDRYLTYDKSALHCKRTIQLLMTTCLYVAVKTAEEKPKGLPLSFFATMSNGLFCEQDIEDMEKKLFETLQWHLFPPTPETFCLHFLEASRGLQVASNQVLYVLDNSLLDFYFTAHPPSHVALAALAFTLRHWFAQPLDRLTRAFDYLEWDREALDGCYSRMVQLMGREELSEQQESPNDVRAWKEMEPAAWSGVHNAQM